MVWLETNDGSFAIAKTMRECLREGISMGGSSKITT
jgi:hypothetical protein